MHECPSETTTTRVYFGDYASGISHALQTSAVDIGGLDASLTLSNAADEVEVSTGFKHSSSSARTWHLPRP